MKDWRGAVDAVRMTVTRLQNNTLVIPRRLSVDRVGPDDFVVTKYLRDSLDITFMKSEGY